MVKLSILKAYHIACKINTQKKEMLRLKLGQEFELRQKTCWHLNEKCNMQLKAT